MTYATHHREDKPPGTDHDGQPDSTVSLSPTTRAPSSLASTRIWRSSAPIDVRGVRVGGAATVGRTQSWSIDPNSYTRSERYRAKTSIRGGPERWHYVAEQRRATRASKRWLTRQRCQRRGRFYAVADCMLVAVISYIDGWAATLARLRQTYNALAGAGDLVR